MVTADAARKLAMRVLMFWYMRGATTEEKDSMCPPGANAAEKLKWRKDMGYQWSSCKSRTLKRAVALVMYVRRPRAPPPTRVRGEGPS